MMRILPIVVSLTGIWTATNSSNLSGPVHDNFLLIANTRLHILYQVDLESESTYVIPIDGVHVDRPRAVGYDPVEQRVYWSNRYAYTISSVHLNGSDATVVVSRVSCHGLIVDDEGRWLFYTDWFDSRIYKVPLSGGLSTTIVDGSGFHPSYIQLDIKLGLIYWLDSDNDQIERADVMGNDREVVVSGKGNIYGLAMNDKELCWFNYDHQYIKCIARDGTNATRVIYHGDCHRIDMSSSHVYVNQYTSCRIAALELATLEIEQIDDLEFCGNTGIYFFATIDTFAKSTRPLTETGTKRTTSRDTTSALTTASTATPIRSSSVDPCTEDGGGCGQYCSSSGRHMTCICSDSFVLSLLDNKTCEDPCAEDNGGCSQKCSVVNHEIVCHCHDGFVVDPDDIRKCSEVDECVSVECGNGGSCKDLVNRFFCQCTGDWRGIYCRQKLEFEPVVRYMQPTVGPVAGKTRITLHGEHFIPGVLVMLGQDLLCSYDSGNGSQATVYTPRVDGSLAGTTLPISIEFPGFQRVETDFTFTYMENPTLESVAPLVSNVVGGTTLTVQGNNLNIISDPELLITMVHESHINSSPKQIKQFYRGDCEVISMGSYMLCQTPQVDIPEAFKSWDDNHGDSIKTQQTTVSKGSTQDQMRPQNDVRLVAEDQSLTFYIGFSLDGVESYKNLSDTLDAPDFGQIIYYTILPEIKVMEFETFIPYSDAKINIKGKDLTHGFEPSDYKVGIGAGWCTGVDVTQNEIICEPPDELPADDVSQEDRSLSATDLEDRGNDERTVLVHIGSNLQMTAGRLKYHITWSSTLDKTDLTPIIVLIAMIVIAVVVIAANVGIGCAIIRKRRNARERAPDLLEMETHGAQPKNAPRRCNDQEDNGEEIVDEQEIYEVVTSARDQQETLGEEVVDEREIDEEARSDGQEIYEVVTRFCDVEACTSECEHPLQHRKPCSAMEGSAASGSGMKTGRQPAGAPPAPPRTYRPQVLPEGYEVPSSN